MVKVMNLRELFALHCSSFSSFTFVLRKKKSMASSYSFNYEVEMNISHLTMRTEMSAIYCMSFLQYATELQKNFPELWEMCDEDLFMNAWYNLEEYIDNLKLKITLEEQNVQQRGVCIMFDAVKEKDNKMKKFAKYVSVSNTLIVLE